jgi:hypothetical protein
MPFRRVVVAKKDDPLVGGVEKRTCTTRVVKICRFVRRELQSDRVY